MGQRKTELLGLAFGGCRQMGHAKLGELTRVRYLQGLPYGLQFTLLLLLASHFLLWPLLLALSKEPKLRNKHVNQNHISTF